jgi:hypothetical protein
MISIIICSINPEFLGQVKENISDTIGLEYELLVWDNREPNIGLCEVYNRMAEQAKYDILCFLHEDIYFETSGWGNLIMSLFHSRNDLGVAGVAGSKYKSATYSGWYTGIKDFDCANINHMENGTSKRIYLKPDDKDTTFEDVVCVDGVFIASRKAIWDRIRFNEKKLRGFHYYDIDYSLRASAICAVTVLYNINIVHITKGGDFGNSWVDTTITFHKDFRQTLPVFLPTIRTDTSTEQKISKKWLDILKVQKISFRNKMKWISDGYLYLKPGLFYSILKFLLYKPLGLRYFHKRNK